ncbi:hypothetical protein [Natronolimnobius baerhuensis]|uniref:Uncharacterized protein n=1 Tax=Natronolimnobius baerhuensis TaxID=253108 RepID=A0A202E3V6_9EURY|nr:hypothetical protein [Natronolimnobius baerhuensis]OVE82965.1 hypothetical protein B2G88_18430 [Natronolimnobius baerhuensis]
MSQAIHTEKSGIKTRVNRLNDLADSVKTLEDEKENIETKRNNRKQRNQAFEEVWEAINDAKSSFNVLCTAVGLAAVLDAPAPRHNIERTLDEYRPQLREFESKSYDDFTDVNEISSTRKEFKAFQETLNEHKETVKTNLEAAADEELSDVETRETILRIPDIGTTTDTEAVTTYRKKIASIKRGQFIDAEELKEAKQRYSEVDIDIGTIRSNYGLSEDAGNLLLRFLRNETVTLADVDDGVLDELKTLEEFSKRLTIQF